MMNGNGLIELKLWVRRFVVLVSLMMILNAVSYLITLFWKQPFSYVYIDGFDVGSFLFIGMLALLQSCVMIKGRRWRIFIVPLVILILFLLLAHYDITEGMDYGADMITIMSASTGRLFTLPIFIALKYDISDMAWRVVWRLVFCFGHAVYLLLVFWLTEIIVLKWEKAVPLDATANIQG
ncbi:MAG: hypothetical protein II899_04645 [Bacteroidales bacterium]|nr:hypothetical protein [Bacteroidales bacterium]